MGQRFNKPILKNVKAGDIPSASEWNKLVAAVRMLTREVSDKQRFSKIKFMRLDEVMGNFGSGDESMDHDRTAIVQYYETTTRNFADTYSSPETYDNVVDGLDLIYDEDELLLCLYHEQSGKYLPVNARTVRHAQTIDDGEYPDSSDCPNCYPIKFIKVAYPETAGAVEPSVSFLDPDDEDPDAYVLNLFDGEDSYLPAGKDIWVYNVTDQWFTFAHDSDNLACQSSSSSSSSESSSKSSASSVSISNMSSLSSLSSSSSFSSFSSLSSLLSSQSYSSQSSISAVSDGSSQSGSLSGGCDTVLPSDITTISNYNASITQVLIHSPGGCLSWMDTESC